MSAQTKKASEIATGDMLHFPNSRHPQEVTFVQRETDEDGGNARMAIQSGVDVRWVVPVDFDVNVDVPE